MRFALSLKKTSLPWHKRLMMKKVWIVTITPVPPNCSICSICYCSIKTTYSLLLCAESVFYLHDRQQNMLEKQTLVTSLHSCRKMRNLAKDMDKINTFNTSQTLVKFLMKNPIKLVFRQLKSNSFLLYLRTRRISQPTAAMVRIVTVQPEIQNLYCLVIWEFVGVGHSNQLYESDWLFLLWNNETCWLRLWCLRRWIPSWWKETESD